MGKFSLALFLFLQFFFDIFLFFTTNSYQKIHWVLYVKSVFFLVVLFYLLKSFLYFLRSQHSFFYRFSLFFIAFVFSVLTASSFVTSVYLNEYLSPSHISYLLKGHYHISSLRFSFFWFFLALAFFLLVFFFYQIFKVSQKREFQSKKVFLLIPLFLILFYHLAKNAQRYRVPITANAFIAMGQSVRGAFFEKSRTVVSYSSGEKVSFESSLEDQDSDIILIINESWGLEAFDSFKGKSMPHLDKAFRQKKWFEFPFAFTNSTSSCVSVSSILTGVSPKEPSHTLFTMPLVSNLAATSHYKTVYFGAQSSRGLNFHEFIQSGNFSLFKTAEEFPLPVVNDTGVDDIFVARELVKVIKKSSNEKLFLVFFTNALHAPHLTHSDHFSFDKTNLSTVEKAMRILDQSIYEIFEALKETGRFKKILIFLTGDHGDRVRNTKGIPRLANYYDDYIRVPFFIKLPEESSFSFQGNQDFNVQNLDIAPTIAHFLGYCFGENKQDFCNSYKGSSLFEPLKKERVLYSLTSTDVHKWDPSGFALVQGEKRYVVSTVESPQFFNISKNINEDKSLKQEKSKDFFKSLIKHNPHLDRVYKKSSKISF